MIQNQQPFRRMRLDEERSQDKGRTLGVWFNESELLELNDYGIFLHQEKPATIIKQMMFLGACAAKLKVEPLERAIRDIVFNNVRKNKRLGIEEIDPNIHS